MKSVMIEAAAFVISMSA